jgi:hypothetical protein
MTKREKDYHKVSHLKIQLGDITFYYKPYQKSIINKFIADFKKDPSKFERDNCFREEENTELLNR